ncbi:MAG: hypothetical protein ABII23_05225 [bacterium]
MKKITWIYLLVCISFSALYAGEIAEDIELAEAELLSDYNLIGNWVNQELTEGLAYNAGSGNLFPAEVIEFPGFEFGFTGGSTIWSIDTAAFKALNLNTLDTSSSTNEKINMKNKIGMFNSIGHIKAALPWFRTDVGARFGEFTFEDDTGDADIEINNVIWGVEVRKRLLGGAWTNIFFPDISLNVSFDSANGKITRQETYSDLLPEKTYDGTSYKQEINVVNSWETTWNVHNIGVKGIISKDLWFFVPFLGLGINKHMGTTKTEIRTAGILSIEEPVFPSFSKTLDIVSQQKKDADDTSLSFFLGLELKILAVRLGLSSEFSGNYASYHAGLRFQFR